MIPVTELKNYARKHKLNLWQAEKEYLLKVFLYLYYNVYDDAIFKGGTSFRFFNGLNRFSEDLDFYLKSPQAFKEQINEVIKGYGDYGISYEIKKEEIFENAYTLTLMFKGPLYSGRRDSMNSIRIDAGYRQGLEKEPEYLSLVSDFVDIPSCLVKTMSLEERFAEKVSTLFDRNKGRDLYDVFFYKSIIELDVACVKKKIHKTKLELTSESQYNRDLKPLLSKQIPYGKVKDGVLAYLQRTSLI